MNIVSVIDGIAFQTNILALNAAVKAASVGELGHCFGVLASDEQTLGISKINAAVRRMDNNTQHNAALVEHAAAAASIGSLLSKAESLASAVGVNIGCARDLREAFSAKCRYPFTCKPLPVPRLFDEFAIKKFVK